MTQHISEDAALYALGLLDEREERAVDEHVARCSACAQLLAQAFDDVAAMAAAQPQYEAPQKQAMPAPRPVRAWRPAFAALAAAIVLALLPAAYLYQENQAMHAAMIADADAMARISSSPHRAVAFDGAPGATVMYGPDGSWYCIIVRDAKKPMDVTWMHDGQQTMLGTAMPHGNVAVLYLPVSHRMDQLALVSENRMVAQARLVF